MSDLKEKPTLDVYEYLPKLADKCTEYRSLNKCKVLAWNHDNRRIYLTLLCYGKEKVVKIPLSTITYDLDIDCSLINKLVRRELK